MGGFAEGETWKWRWRRDRAGEGGGVVSDLIKLSLNLELDWVRLENFPTPT